MCPYADRPDAIPLANIFAERPLSVPASSQPRSPVVGFGVVVDNVQRSVRLIDLRVPAAGFPTRPNRRCTCRHGSELRPFIKIVRRHHRDPARSEFSPVSNMLIVLSVVLLVSSAFNIEAETPPDGAAGRAKRQLPPIEEGNQVIDNIFQIPISTLNAVGSLIKSTRPLVRRTRERIQQYYNNGQLQQLSATYQQQRPQYIPAYNRPGSAVYGGGNQRPFYGGGGNYGSSNRKKQQRDDPPAQGRHGHRRDRDDDY